MKTFLKVQASSLSASALDFLITILCVQVLGMWYLLGNILGLIAGGIFNFLISRYWVFDAAAKRIETQFLKYALVWAGNFILVTAGVYALTHYAHLNYILSKILVSGFMGIAYTYFLQKKFIFSK